jgi:hypothetical protein
MRHHDSGASTDYQVSAANLSRVAQLQVGRRTFRSRISCLKTDRLKRNDAQQTDTPESDEPTLQHDLYSLSLNLDSQ